MKINIYSHLHGVLFGFQIYNHPPMEFENEKISERFSIQIYLGFFYVVISSKTFNLGVFEDL